MTWTGPDVAQGGVLALPWATWHSSTWIPTLRAVPATSRDPQWQLPRNVPACLWPLGHNEVATLCAKMPTDRGFLPLFQDGDDIYFMKGAFEEVMRSCTTYNNGGIPLPLTPQQRAFCLQEEERMGSLGLRGQCPAQRGLSACTWRWCGRHRPVLGHRPSTRAAGRLRAGGPAGLGSAQAKTGARHFLASAGHRGRGRASLAAQVKDAASRRCLPWGGLSPQGGLSLQGGLSPRGGLSPQGGLA